MADKRMFDRSIVLSDAFLEMPPSTRCLYFTLSMYADDDGFVGNPKSIIRQIGATEDDMKLLLVKRYVLSFESGVVVIKHWRINNYLRSDRHKSTTYQEELSKLGFDSKGAYTELEKHSNNGNGIPTDNQLPTIGIHSIDKSSVDKNSIDNIDYQIIIDKFNSICTSLPNVRALSEPRKKAIKSRIKENVDFDSLFRKVNESDFLSGRKTDWKASFDWILKPSNLNKILEGNYDNSTSSSKGTMYTGQNATYDLEEYQKRSIFDD